MERFFFHLDEDGTILEDVEGIELPNLNAAPRIRGAGRSRHHGA